MSTAFLACTILGFAPALLAREVSSQPALRIETGMHTATISRIAVDAGERVVVTGSWDKTVRVWDPRSGRLVRTIDLPAGGGNEGQVYALAITPDGKTIAAGGWTGWDWDGSASIYFFDRENGHLVRRIGGLSGRPIRMAYSPDGKWLAVGLRGANGIRVFDRSGQLAGEDREYDSDTSGIAFSTDGKLVSSSRDGFLRLYALPSSGKPLRLITKKKSESGQHPFGVSFAPGGGRIAVGFDDLTSVVVLSAADLTPLFQADTTGIANGNLSSVAWSSDGSQLCAGGVSANAEASRIVRIWFDRGKGSWRDVPVAGDTIMDIAPLPSGGFVFASGDPSWGRIGSSGQPRFVTRATIADYRGGRDGLKVSSDGMTVEFEFRLGREAARYSVSKRDLAIHTTADPSLHRPRTAVPGLEIEHWQNLSEPMLNGQPLPLDRDEIARSLAVARDGTSVLVGTEWNLRLFDRNGAKQWSVPAPDVVWAVNLSDDSGLAIAAFADGTIRWFRMRDGQELFALFPHPDGKWVVWTAGGYYDCSPGAEQLIGWHLNRGRENAADFFPISRFRSTFYRPDVIANIITTRDEGEALRLALNGAGTKDIAKLLPPVVEITHPADDSTVSSRDLSIFFDLRTPSGEPVTSIRAYVNGRPVPVSKGGRPFTGPPSPADDELTIPIPPENAEVSIVAYNRLAASVPAILHLQWHGPKPSSAVKPVLYLLAIGVSQYRDQGMSLDYPSKDADDFANALSAPGQTHNRHLQMKILHNDEATRKAVLEAFEWIGKQSAGPQDLVMVFIAGHGISQEGQYYFIPYDGDVASAAATAVPSSAIEKVIGSVRARAMLLVDTCHAGKLFGERLSGDVNSLVNSYSAPENGIVTIAASTGAQQSFEDRSWGNGAFTKAVVEGLTGRASASAEVTVFALAGYVADRVRQLTAGRQTPAIAIPNTIPNFPIVLTGTE